ncbi:hypothetical protein HWB51_gp102 [Mycobacterium phage Cuke]|uniref:Uncharacterized protein n=1 Tax=Mycobacterium phage Cuke TaxID=2079417 RepID=A0A2L1IWX2_9CAUD|nr:hypothetical protein HWB51_gp102 [Mycobacterium phage Cuke]AVD99710.1 hypothetical protein SEA_CUKE_94 [Mycobacterium phage Cuke]
MSTNNHEEIVTRISLGGNDFELAETPKGLLIPRINGMDLTTRETKELKEALEYVIPD